jgi:hypothetical protein
MESDWQTSVVDPIEALLQRWRKRGDSEALETLLPAWRGNAGLTDGWNAVLEALTATLDTDHLPSDEAEVVTAVAARIALALSSPAH